jgi:hypothetical protein
MGDQMRFASLMSLAGLLLVSSGCKSAPAVDYVPKATFREVMESIVEPSADFLWESVATIVTAKGVDRKVPHTDEEWLELHKRAIALVEVTNLLLIPNRHVAKPGEKADNPEFERDPQVIETMMKNDRATFLTRLNGLRQVALEMLQAVEAKDPMAIEDVGDKLDMACENCHMTYWYLPDK